MATGSISNKVIEVKGDQVSREHSCFTASFDYNSVDDAPAPRFMNQFIETIKRGDLLKAEFK